MIATSCTLAVVLALETTTPAASSNCLTADNLCKAKRSEQRAATAKTPDQRAQYLHSAHRSYLFLFDQTGDARDLCAARRTFDESLAVAGQSEAQRASAAGGELVARERLHGPRCGRLAKQRLKKSPPPAVAKVEPMPSVDPVREGDLGNEAPPLLVSGTTTTERPPPPDVPPPTAATRPPVDDVFMPMPIPVRRTSPAARTREPRPGRGLVIAGGVTLGAGVALSTAAGFMGHDMLATRQAYFALHNATGGTATVDQKNRADTLFHDYKAMWPQTLAMALAGGTTVLIAAVLAGVGGRRMARAASRTAVVPVPGGLALHTRF